MTAQATQEAASANMPEPSAAATHQEIAALAYTLWQQRGCPDGSSEEDWLNAEQELEGRSRG